MRYKLARTLLVAGFVTLVLRALPHSDPGSAAPATPAIDVVPAPAPPPKPERIVYLAGNLGPDDLLAFSTAVAASSKPGLLLVDRPLATVYTKAFLAAYQPDKVVPVGHFPYGQGDLKRRLGVDLFPVLEWQGGHPEALWHALFPRADRVIVCPAEPRGLLLQTACLAGILKAPLFVTSDRTKDRKTFRRWVKTWQAREVIAVGDSRPICQGLPGIHVSRCANEQAVARMYLRELASKSPIQTLVVANPADSDQGAMSLLAPWLALDHHAALLLTNPDGDNTAEMVAAAVKAPALRRAEYVILAGSLEAIPMERRDNPVAGKDAQIEMEPLTPAGEDCWTYAVGRIFHEDPGVVFQMLAQQKLLDSDDSRRPRKVLVASNADGGLELLETMSRCTTQEFRSNGYDTTSLFGDDVSRKSVRKLMPESDIFLWEGHHNTLIKDYKFPKWTEPLKPSLVFIQSCLALTEEKVHPLFLRGAVSVVGSSTRTYSASGGAFSMSFFDALLYDGQSLGGSLRHAKNFLLAYSKLKEKRLGKEVKLAGANVRSAWAFTLWGDPTLKLPRPAGASAVPCVQHKVHGRTIILTIPECTCVDPVSTDKFVAKPMPNCRLAGLVQPHGSDQHRLVPLAFAEVHLPHVPAGQTPRLRSRVPSSRWVFCWDARRRCGYLLVAPRAKDRNELRFHVQWNEEISDFRMPNADLKSAAPWPDHPLPLGRWVTGFENLKSAF